MQRYHKFLWWIGMVVGIFLLLAGCKEKVDPPAPLQTFTAEIAFQCGELTGAAQMTRSNPSMLSLSFVAPQTLEGFEMECNQGMVTISFQQVSVSMTNSLPDSALITVLSQAFDKVEASEQVQVSFDGENWTFDDTLSNTAGDFRLTVTQSGEPVAFAAEQAGISVTFSQVQQIL